ncbi:MAG: hypothetical protein LBM70_03575 [Victivallales bacterium]|nr:hypothetical protein [Victivallales bacterium]
MRFDGKIVVLLFALVGVIAGCKQHSCDLRQDSLLYKAYTERVNTPFEYRAKLVEDPYFVRRREQLLGGTLALNRDELRRDLARLEREIELGRQWKSPVPTAKIPFTDNPPVIDGKINADEWDGALTYQGEYPLNSELPISSEAVWKLQYDKEFIYFAATIFDSEVIPGSPESPYNGDAVELFLLPDFRLVDYLEAVVSADGNLYTAWAYQSPQRHYDLKVCTVSRAKAKTSLTSGGYTVELKIPFSALPGYLLGNAPQKGETMNFMMIRCELDKNGRYSRNTPTPFLYDGHNIYGYVRGILE